MEDPRDEMGPKQVANIDREFDSAWEEWSNNPGLGKQNIPVLRHPNPEHESNKNFNAWFEAYN